MPDHVIALTNSFAPVRIVRAGAFCLPKKIFSKIFSIFSAFRIFQVLKGYERGNPAITRFRAVAKGGEKMNEPNRTQWQIRCAFNGYCKRALRNEAINAHRDVKYQQLNEVSFSELSPQEENQLYTYDTYFEDEEAEKSFCVAGKEITAKLLAEALHSLPEEKREAVLLYYFFDMNDTEIAMLRNVPRSTVQYRRTSSFELLKRYLEGKAHDW